VNRASSAQSTKEANSVFTDFPIANDRWWRLSEAVHRTPYNQDQLLRLVARGELEGSKLGGGRWYVSDASLRRHFGSAYRPL
jgi:hypothetical protein